MLMLLLLFISLLTIFCASKLSNVMGSPQRSSKYESHMPNIREKPPQMYKPKRKGEENMGPNEKDVLKSLHVGEYYEFVANSWNKSHNGDHENQFTLFEDGLNARDRTKIHKRRIGEHLAELVGDIYAKLTLSKARRVSFIKMKAALENIFDDPLFFIYRKHSFNGWLIEKLVEQKIESASREARSKNKNSDNSLVPNSTQTTKNQSNVSPKVGKNNIPIPSFRFAPTQVRSGNKAFPAEEPIQSENLFKSGNDIECLSEKSFLQSESQLSFSASEKDDAIHPNEQVIKALPINGNNSQQLEEIEKLEEQNSCIESKEGLSSCRRLRRYSKFESQ